MRNQGVALGLVLAAGCTSMQTVEPSQFIPQHRPETVSVWTTRDDVIVVSNPEIERDTLTGEVYDAPWTVPLTRVVKVEAVTRDTRRTIFFITGAAAAAAGVYLIGHSSKGSGAVPCPPIECPATTPPL
jgi:hypothetical protein